MAVRGRPRVSGAFEETSCFQRLIERGCFLTVDDLVSDRSLLVEPLSAVSVRRRLRSWGIRSGDDQPPDAGGSARTITVRWSKWQQPEETRYGSKAPVSGCLWQILTGSGLKAFLLTADDSRETVAKVAERLQAWLGNRKRTVVTNHRVMAEALRSELCGWVIEFTHPC